MSAQQLSTNALHQGHDVAATQGTRSVPIFQSTAYVFKDSDHAAKLFSLAEPGYIYTRLNNPTVDVLEQRIAALEGGLAAVATASGTSALSTAILVLLVYANFSEFSEGETFFKGPFYDYQPGWYSVVGFKIV